MSMSQEEIESLMNGLDFEDNSKESSEPESQELESQENMSEDDINELIAQTEEISTKEESSEESVDEILANLETVPLEEDSSNDTNIDDILKEFEDNNSVEETVSEEVSNENIDELLSTIDSIENEEKPEIEESSLVDKILNETEHNKKDENIDSKIDLGVFPLPVEDDTKVVNQLSEVANDSEEKASKIFDVLSNILDYNSAIQNDIKALSSFNEKQTAMLSSLSSKFPNIEAFSENLKHAEQMGEYINDVNEKLNDGNTEIFQAMELMQYHDINRQKIERVMSVIRKLSTYLNNLFEDEGNRAEVVVANHIHGDNTEDLVDGEDLEALIAEFNK